MIRFAATAIGCATLAVALAGCASVVPFDGLRLDEGGLYVSGVTPVRQDRKLSCGPACLAAVAMRWGVEPARLLEEARGIGSESNGRDLQRLAARLGLEAFVYRGSMDDLRRNVGEGRPLIAMIAMPLPPRGDLVASAILELWNEVGPRPAHWVVVVGTVGDQWVIVDDPASGPLALRTASFRRWWEKEGSVVVLVAGPIRSGAWARPPPGHAPGTRDPGPSHFAFASRAKRSQRSAPQRCECSSSKTKDSWRAM